jgi:hypothetical protein
MRDFRVSNPLVEICVSVVYDSQRGGADERSERRGRRDESTRRMRCNDQYSAGEIVTRQDRRREGNTA